MATTRSQHGEAAAKKPGQSPFPEYPLGRLNFAWCVVIWLISQLSMAASALTMLLLQPLKILYRPAYEFCRVRALGLGWTPTFIALRLSTKIRIVQTGDEIPDGLIGVMANHQSYCDSFIVGYLLHTVFRSDGSIWIIWKSFLSIPLGWCSKMVEHVFVGYGKDKDLKSMTKGTTDMVARYIETVTFFPEGTVGGTRRAELRKKAADYASSQGLPEYRHHLCPKVGAFNCITKALIEQGSKEYVDLTIGFPSDTVTGKVWNENPFEFWRIMAWNNEWQDVHIHIRRIPLSDLGETEETQNKWLYSYFEEKDRLMDNFRKTGAFPGQRSYVTLNLYRGFRDLIIGLAVLFIMFTGMASLPRTLLLLSMGQPGAIFEPLTQAVRRLVSNAMGVPEGLSP